MSSKTSFIRFGHFAALLALIATVGCGSGGGGGDNTNPAPNPGPGGGDTTAPHFGGLTGVSSTNGNVTLTANEGSDDVTPKPQLRYLIYVSESTPVDKSGAPHATFTGANCAGGACSFDINDLDKSGIKKYYFASSAKDLAENVDTDPHPTEAGLSISPLAPINTGVNHPTIPTVGVNAQDAPGQLPTTHAVHPAIVTLKGVPYVIWEDCADATGASASAEHPCTINDVSKIFVRHWNGSTWVKDTDDNGLQGNATVASQTVVHRHAPTLATDGNLVYASWEESWLGNETPTRQAHKAIYTNSFNGNQWSGPVKVAGDGGQPGRPALTTVAQGGKLGIGYELSPACCPNAQLFFKQQGDAGIGTLLNKNPNHKAEAAAFSQAGSQLWVSWKETPPGQNPNIFVRMFNGTGWDLIGDSLNINTAHEARLPSIDVKGTTPYVAWHECLESGCGNRHIFVKHWDGAQWVQDKDTGTCNGLPDCGSLNVNSFTAETPSLVVFGDKVFVSWAERNDSTNPPVYKIQLKSLNGSQWLNNGTRNTAANQDGFTPVLYADNTNNTGLYTAWVERGANGRLQLHVQ